MQHLLGFPSFIVAVFTPGKWQLALSLAWGPLEVGRTFHKQGYPGYPVFVMDGLQWNMPLKWMIYGHPYDLGNLHMKG